VGNIQEEDASVTWRLCNYVALQAPYGRTLIE